MAKAVTIKVKLVSSADTGFYYVAKKNSRTMTDKLVKKKYDPVARKHVEFREFQDQVGFRPTADDFERGPGPRFYFAARGGAPVSPTRCSVTSAMRRRRTSAAYAACATTRLRPSCFAR